MRNALEANFDEILDFYNQSFKVTESYPFKVYITDDIFSLRMDLCNTDDEQHMVMAAKQKLNSFNGLLVEPDLIDNIFYILIKQNSSNDSNIYSKTFSHEYTHVIDYQEFKEKYEISNMRNNEVYENSECFQFYSEVRARFRGSLIFYQLSDVKNDVLIKDYNDYLIPAYQQKLNQNTIYPDNYQKMYMLAQFYGQFLAIGCKTNSLPTLPDYIKNNNAIELLLAITNNIGDVSIFANYESIIDLYDNSY
ncbi:hypothetical protein ACIZ62_12785 [Acetobacterium carbinolicum]|uniref:hypothetical protein n=1 Tax=Acetobacterium carbinolicum TaxID=52690 RepID=UPI0039BF5585